MNPFQKWLQFVCCLWAWSRINFVLGKNVSSRAERCWEIETSRKKRNNLTKQTKICMNMAIIYRLSAVKYISHHLLVVMKCKFECFFLYNTKKYIRN